MAEAVARAEGAPTAARVVDWVAAAALAALAEVALMAVNTAEGTAEAERAAAAMAVLPAAACMHTHIARGRTR